MRIAELDLDLEAFEGPFDLLLTLVLREEIDLAEIDIAGIVLAFVEHLLVEEHDEDTDVEASLKGQGREIDLEFCGEFLVLVSALLELKAQQLFSDEGIELLELEPEEAAEELARRLAEYRRIKEAAAWFERRLEQERTRFFRLGPAPLQPRPEQPLAPQDPCELAAAMHLLASEPPAVSLAHMALRYPPLSRFVESFRTLLSRHRRFDFEQEVAGLSRVEQAVAFLALLELGRLNEISVSQSAPFAPIRVERKLVERSLAWTSARSA